MLTDKLSIAAGVIAPAILYVAGEPMDATIQAAVAWGVLIMVSGVVLLRLITAPYFIWRDDQATINQLRAEFDSPKQKEREKRAELIAEQKFATVEVITRIRRIIVDFEKNHDEKLRAFSGAELYSDKFMYDRLFCDAWYAFHDACDIAFEQWQLFWKEEGDITRFMRATTLVDIRASALVDYLLYEKTPEPTVPEEEEFKLREKRVDHLSL